MKTLSKASKRDQKIPAHLLMGIKREMVVWRNQMGTWRMCGSASVRRISHSTFPGHAFGKPSAVWIANSSELFLEVDGFLLGKQSPFPGLALTLGMALIVLALLFLLGALGGKVPCTSVLWRTWILALWWHLNGYWLVKNPLVGLKQLSTHTVWQCFPVFKWPLSSFELPTRIYSSLSQ